MNRIDILKNVTLAKGVAWRVRIDGKPVLIDLATAKVCVEVYDHLSEAHRTEFDSLPWDECVALAWRLTLRPGHPVAAGGRVDRSAIKALIIRCLCQVDQWLDALIDRYLATREQ